MPIGTSLSLSPDSPTDVDTNAVAYTLRAADEDRSVFAVAGLTYPTEFLVEIGHKTDKNGVRRSVVKMIDTRLDSLNVPATSTMAFTIVRPPSSAFTEATLLQQAFRLVDFLIEGGAGANISKLLNLET